MTLAVEVPLIKVEWIVEMFKIVPRQHILMLEAEKQKGTLEKEKEELSLGKNFNLQRYFFSSVNSRRGEHSFIKQLLKHTCYLLCVAIHDCFDTCMGCLFAAQKCSVPNTRTSKNTKIRFGPLGETCCCYWFQHEGKGYSKSKPCEGSNESRC